MRDHYFHRAVTWNVLGGHVAAYARERARAVTLDDWREVAFLAADGTTTVGEFIEKARAAYEDEPPPELAEHVQAVILELVEGGLVTLTAMPRALPPYLARPLSEQRPGELTRQMVADGFFPKAPRRTP